MLHTTTWQPDTCGCEIEYEWDDTLSEADRVHTIKNVNRACESHTGLKHEDHFASVVDENTRKNKTHGLILENLTDLVDETIDKRGQKTKKLKDGIEYKWSFDKNRTLQVTIAGGNQTHKDSLAKLANSLFGNGKVKVA